MAGRHLTIGQLAHMTGISARTIRYYEASGLLPRPPRGENHYRRYSAADVNRVLLLRQIRLLGVPPSAARHLLLDATAARCADVQQEVQGLLDERLAAIDREVAGLRRLRAEVQRYQRALARCLPTTSEMSFAACPDVACLALAHESAAPDGRESQEQDHAVCCGFHDACCA